VLEALLVAEVDGGLVGTLIAAFDGWRGNMYRLAVRDDMRRRGIARELVEAGHARLRAVGARRVTALVGADEQAAVALWRSAGYEHDPVHQRFVRNL
jgi:ribosomal protein S18 acetylase RimI-like enzyme